MYRQRALAEYTTAAVIAAAVVFAIYSWIHDYVLPGASRALLAALTATGAYFIVFKTLLLFYSRCLWQIVNRRSYIGGSWSYTYDVFSNDGATYERTNCPGEARITHTMDCIHFSAESADPDDKSGSSAVKTLWDTTSCFTYEGRIIAGIEFSNEKGTGLGFFVLHVVSDSTLLPHAPTELRGHYIFLAGSKVSRGRVCFLKSGAKDTKRPTTPRTLPVTRGESPEAEG